MKMLKDSESQTFATYVLIVAMAVMGLSLMVFGIDWKIPVITAFVAMGAFVLINHISAKNSPAKLASVLLIFAIVPNIVLMLTDKTKAQATTFNIVLLLVAMVIVFSLFLLPDEKKRKEYLMLYFRSDDIFLSIGMGFLCFMVMYMVSSMWTLILMSTTDFSEVGMSLLTTMDVGGSSVMAGFLLSALLVVNCNAIAEDLLRAVLDINTQQFFDATGVTGIIGSIFIGFTVAFLWGNLHFAVSMMTYATLLTIVSNGVILVLFQRKFGLLSNWVGHSLYNILIIASSYGMF